jgi:hypothetical protein
MREYSDGSCFNKTLQVAVALLAEVSDEIRNLEARHLDNPYLQAVPMPSSARGNNFRLIGS